jgi:hypothetical protein
MKKIFIFLLLIAGCESKAAIDNDNVQRNLKTEFVLGVGLAVIAHIITELPIILTHEAGHSLASKLTGGNFGKIDIDCILFGNSGLGALAPPQFLFPIQPFVGKSYSSGGNNKAMIAGGPIGGHIALLSLLVLIQILEKTSCTSSETNLEKTSDILHPFSFYASIAKDVEELRSGKKYSANWKKVFFTTFKFLKTGRLCGEFLYGFTPLCDINGDGAKLWGCSLNQGFPVLFGLSLFPAILSVLVGTLKAFYFAKNHSKKAVKALWRGPKLRSAGVPRSCA